LLRSSHIDTVESVAPFTSYWDNTSLVKDSGIILLLSTFPDMEIMHVQPSLFRGFIQGYQEIYPLFPLEMSPLFGTLVMIKRLFAAFSLDAMVVEGA